MKRILFSVVLTVVVFLYSFSGAEENQTYYWTPEELFFHADPSCSEKAGSNQTSFLHNELDRSPYDMLAACKSCLPNFGGRTNKNGHVLDSVTSLANGYLAKIVRDWDSGQHYLRLYQEERFLWEQALGAGLNTRPNLISTIQTADGRIAFCGTGRSSYEVLLHSLEGEVQQVMQLTGGDASISSAGIFLFNESSDTLSFYDWNGKKRWENRLSELGFPYYVSALGDLSHVSYEKDKTTVIACIDGNGEIMWRMGIGDSEKYHSIFALTPKSNGLIVTSSSPFGINFGASISFIDNHGNLLWQRELTHNGDRVTILGISEEDSLYNIVGTIWSDENSLNGLPLSSIQVFQLTVSEDGDEMKQSIRSFVGTPYESLTGWIVTMYLHEGGWNIEGNVEAADNYEIYCGPIYAKFQSLVESGERITVKDVN